MSLRNTIIPVTDVSAGLRITEIFHSLQGEALTAGIPTVFVRLTGCPLRCVYCDTAYAFEGGERMSLDNIIDKVNAFPAKHICVTGGEPLAQPNCLPLLTQLCDAGYAVSLETAGALDVSQVDTRVSKVMDLKTPSSGEADKNRWANLNHITPHDQLKFVIMNRADYDWAKTQLLEKQLADKTQHIWFSPMFSLHESHELPTLAKDLAEWILDDGLPVRMQLQLHKLIWADAQGK